LETGTLAPSRFDLFPRENRRGAPLNGLFCHGIPFGKSQTLDIMSRMKRIITGVKPTGASMHLGNLMGAVLPFGKQAIGNDAAIFIADLHALTSVKDGETLRRQSLEVATQYLAFYGKDTQITIFRQSDIRQIAKLMWVLANVTPLSLMLRAHSFKDAEAKNADINMGVFNYPILMAADIIGYDIDLVPVGKDQVQHLEMARDIARAFNKAYGSDTFSEPAAYVDASVAVIPGTDGRKMSKSYNNFIGIFDDEKKMKKDVMSIVTDSKGVDDVKDPETCNVFALIKTFGTPDRVEAIRTKYLTANAGYGYGHAKLELLEIIREFLSPYHAGYEALKADPTFVEAKLAEGAIKMNARLDAKMEEVSRLTGV
jgi:tryptophanyl-tRNA synthetase